MKNVLCLSRRAVSTLVIIELISYKLERVDHDSNTSNGTGKTNILQVGLDILSDDRPFGLYERLSSSVSANSHIRRSILVLQWAHSH